MAMIKNMLFPYDGEDYLNRFVSAAVYTCLYRVGDYIKKSRNDTSGLYIKKAMAEHKTLVKLIGEIKIEARKPQQENANFQLQNKHILKCRK